MRRFPAVFIILFIGCSQHAASNYKHCLKLRVGMSRQEMLSIMGPPEETLPFIEGQSLEYLKGRTAYEWSNPASMPGPDHISVDDSIDKITSIRCANSEITAPVLNEPMMMSSPPAGAYDKTNQSPGKKTRP